MFPFDVDETEDLAGIEPIEMQESSDYEINFETNELTGRIITGLEAVKQWAQMCLGTDRYYYNQYSWDYGSELRELIGKEYQLDYITSECKRIIEDCLSVNPEITGIQDLEIMHVDDLLIVNFTLLTIYGSEEMSVNV